MRQHQRPVPLAPPRIPDQAAAYWSNSTDSRTASRNAGGAHLPALAEQLRRTPGRTARFLSPIEYQFVRPAQPTILPCAEIPPPEFRPARLLISARRLVQPSTLRQVRTTTGAPGAAELPGRATSRKGVWLDRWQQVRPRCHANGQLDLWRNHHGDQCAAYHGTFNVTASRIRARRLRSMLRGQERPFSRLDHTVLEALGVRRRQLASTLLSTPRTAAHAFGRGSCRMLHPGVILQPVLADSPRSRRATTPSAGPGCARRTVTTAAGQSLHQGPGPRTCQLHVRRTTSSASTAAGRCLAPRRRSRPVQPPGGRVKYAGGLNQRPGGRSTAARRRHVAVRASRIGTGRELLGHHDRVDSLRRA